MRRTGIPKPSNVSFQIHASPLCDTNVPLDRERYSRPSYAISLIPMLRVIGWGRAVPLSAITMITVSIAVSVVAFIGGNTTVQL
ncbi:hypothetical protein [Thermofilum sp.]|uniref:hypothetical protein n=1 Tax=Thermofilum sp. TaxID=1961369 RepID=UPI00315FF600